MPMKRQHFFITGLPRSRTAWLANFFTYGKSVCWHDASRRDMNARGVIDCFRDAGGAADYVGDADSGLPFLGLELARYLPEARWLIVRRDITQARESFAKFFRERPYRGVPMERTALERIFDHCQEKLQELAAGLPAGSYIECEFRDLDSNLVLEEAWRFLTPGNPWSSLRCELLQGIEINVKPDKLWQ